MQRRHFFIGTCAALMIASSGLFPVQAQGKYPEKPVEFIVPWAPGGGSDAIMRIVAKQLEDELGQPFPVINVPGASGTLGLQQVAKAKPDGYTISQIHDGLLTSFHTDLTKLNWDSFTPVGLITSSPQFIVISANSPWKTLEEFVAHAKKNPGKIKFGVTLAGVPHLHAAMVGDATGTEFGYVGYEGTGERIRGLLGGTVEAAIGDVASAGQFVKNGDLRFLAVGSEERLPEYPDVPTLKELGYDIDLSINRGLVVPKGTPQERIDVLEEALSKVAKDQDAIQQIKNAGGDVVFRSQEDYVKSLQRLDETVKRLSSKLAS
ncbi:Bug family tripartite tricarboxylate transporter substrate binding protein [Microvirga makkahensis]|uniref:Tripartite tricarboxylate transporter substrate binding protein n=1 Tax=Microvirga makkahensis TaxID=1128670 RepID=A0A7X3SP00_9HYPH|nr:tripartite tricarboxylate transporter substrate binding protein [Microvirga makkahensis]MXQ11733.1 tripartite tricarboxylate transporter substrate binding protein [Microvirga makkahensis]